MDLTLEKIRVVLINQTFYIEFSTRSASRVYGLPARFLKSVETCITRELTGLIGISEASANAGVTDVDTLGVSVEITTSEEYASGAIADAADDALAGEGAEIGIYFVMSGFEEN